MACGSNDRGQSPDSQELRDEGKLRPKPESQASPQLACLHPVAEAREDFPKAVLDTAGPRQVLTKQVSPVSAGAQVTPEPQSVALMNSRELKYSMVNEASQDPARGLGCTRPDSKRDL